MKNINVVKNHLCKKLSVILLMALPSSVWATSVIKNGDIVTIEDDSYRMNIALNQFKYSFNQLDNSVIAPSHDTSGLTLNGANVLSAVYNEADSSADEVRFLVTFADQSTATVSVFPLGKSVRISVEPTLNTRGHSIYARVGAVNGPFYGLGDDGRVGNISNLTDKTIGNDGGHDRFISTFTIAPNSAFAQVAISQVAERYLSTANSTVPHKVTINNTAVEMGTHNVNSNKHFYYFFGSPKDIYQSFSDAKVASGYPDMKPLYGMFGIGWEAWPFQKYATDATTVAASITNFVDTYHYPLSWAVIGSGFWEDGGTTTSFGRFNLTKFPDGNGDGVPDIISTVRSKGAKIMFGLRTNFTECKGSNDFSGGGTDGGQGSCYDPLVEPPEHAQANANNYFAKKSDGSNFESASNIFPQWDTDFELLDANNSNAVQWYKDKTALWGVDGWKEDSMLTSGIYHPGAWNAPMVSLHKRGDYVMARNAYVSSPGSIQRLNDTSGQQARIPQLVLSYAASGAPNVYTDIVGNHQGSNATYMERHAKLAALTASMSFGANPWALSTAANIKAAADWHEKYRPYIYSAALKTYETGYPYTATPMPIAFPSDSDTYNLDNNSMWQWLIDESMLAAPVFNSSNSSGLRDVYLPAGYWIDSNTNIAYSGPGILADYDQSGTKMPVFIGGKGIVVHKSSGKLTAQVWPVKPNSVASVSYQYRHFESAHDGSDIVSAITLENTGWDISQLVVTNITTGAVVSDVVQVTARGGIDFSIIAGNNYRISGGGNSVKAGGPNVGTLTEKAVNVAQGKSVTVDSTYNDSYVGQHAVDGDNNSDSVRWISANDSSTHYIEVDLEATMNVNSVKFWTGFQGAGALTSYTISYWNGSTWQAIVNRNSNTSSAVTEEFSAVSTSKIRLSSNDWIKLYELAIFSEPTAKIADISATSSDDYNASYTASNAVDGDNSTNASRWISQDTDNSHWLEISLPAVFNVDAVKFWTGWNGYNSPLSNYSLEYWDGSQWQTIKENNNNSLAEVSEQFDSVKTNKLRLVTTSWAKVYEVEVYGRQQNIALNKSATSSSDFSTSYVSENALDGDKESNSSRWISNEFNGPHYIEIDLESIYRVSQVKFWTGWNGYNLPLENFTIAYWDGTAWVDIVQESGNTQAVVDKVFDSVETSKIRLQSDDWIKLYEIEIY